VFVVAIPQGKRDMGQDLAEKKGPKRNIPHARYSLSSRITSHIGYDIPPMSQLNSLADRLRAASRALPSGQTWSKGNTGRNPHTLHSTYTFITGVLCDRATYIQREKKKNLHSAHSRGISCRRVKPTMTQAESAQPDGAEESKPTAPEAQCAIGPRYRTSHE
jgi:hypothetical protein